MTQEQISRVFWEKCIGLVSRIDYFQNVLGLWCAFVHFEYVNNKNSIIDTISNEILSHGSYQLWFNESEYLILRPMTCKKIPETRLNIHQIAQNLEKLEEKFEEKLEEKDAYILGLQNASNDDKNKIALLEGNLQYTSRRIAILEENVHRLEQINWNRDEEMEQMVTSLVGPRWTEDDDIDAQSPIFVVSNESKFDDDDVSILSNEMR